MPSSSAFYDSRGYREALHHLLDITYFPDEPGYLPMDLTLQQLSIHDLCDFICCPSSNFVTLQYDVVDHSASAHAAAVHAVIFLKEKIQTMI